MCVGRERGNKGHTKASCQDVSTSKGKWRTWLTGTQREKGLERSRVAEIGESEKQATE